MESNPVFLIEFLGFAGIGLAWALWQLWTVRRRKDVPPPVDRDKDES
jgi:hypothetical protein